MGVFVKNHVRFGPVLALLMVVSLIVTLSACGGTDESASTSRSSAASGDSGQTSSTIAESTTASTLSLHDRIQQEQAGSTTIPSVTTTAEESATTTVGATTTTGHGATTTAQPTSTTGTTARSTTTTVKPTTTTAKGPVVLRVTGPSGTVELSMAELKAMWATAGYGGWKNQLGNITAPVSWKGVALANLMDLVGGGSSVLVVASDGYEQPLSAGELGGAVTTYDPATGAEISSISGSITVIVAYAKGGGAITGEEGPLRIAFVSPEKDQVTDSAMWVRMVTRITVR